MIEPQSIVFVVDDDVAVRSAIENLLRSVGLAVQTFGTAQEFRQYKLPDAPACIVLDVRMPGQSGLELQRTLTTANIFLPVIFLSGQSDIPMSVRAMKSGAVEFLTKPMREQELLDAIQLGVERDRARRQETKALVELHERLVGLTQREREVLPLVIAGLQNKQIAARLDVSEITVKVHRGQVMRKMRARSVVDLVRMADVLGISAESA